MKAKITVNVEIDDMEPDQDGHIEIWVKDDALNYSCIYVTKDNLEIIEQ